MIFENIKGQRLVLFYCECLMIPSYWIAYEKRIRCEEYKETGDCFRTVDDDIFPRAIETKVINNTPAQAEAHL
jgi:hypothetical protein